MQILDDGTIIFEEGEDDGAVTWEVAACHYYTNVGNIAATARRFQTTVYEIKKLMGTSWWQDLTVQIKRDAQVKIDAGFTRLIEKGMQKLEDRLDHGEIASIKTEKDGSTTIRRAPMRAIDIAKITDMAFMKRQLVRNEPTVIPGDTQALSILAQKLRALGKKDPSILDAPSLEAGGTPAQFGDEQ